MLCSLVNWATEISTASSMHEIKKACVRGRLRSMGDTGRTEERLLASAAGRPISRWGQFSEFGDQAPHASMGRRRRLLAFNAAPHGAWKNQAGMP